MEYIACHGNCPSAESLVYTQFLEGCESLDLVDKAFPKPWFLRIQRFTETP